MSTNDTQNKHHGGKPQVLPPTASPPGSELVIIIDAYGGQFNTVYANAPMRMVLVNWDEPFFLEPDADDDEPVNIDGEKAYIMEFSIGPDRRIDEKVARALNAAGVDMPGLPATASEGKADSE